jgi:hypothetical protein
MGKNCLKARPPDEVVTGTVQGHPRTRVDCSYDEAIPCIVKVRHHLHKTLLLASSLKFTHTIRTILILSLHLSVGLNVSLANRFSSKILYAFIVSSVI